MPLDRNEINRIIAANICGDLTSEETALLNEWLQDGENRLFHEELTNPENLLEDLTIFHQCDKAKEEDREKVWKKYKKYKKETAPASHQWNRLAIAATILLLIMAPFVALFLGREKNISSTPWFAKLDSAGIIPKGNDAILRTPDKYIVLNSAFNESLVKDIKVKMKREEYQYELLCSYTNTARERTFEKQDKEKQHYNLLATPQSRQMKLTLTDRTQVKVNEVTAIAFLPGFAGNERDIYIVKGEAWFDVAKDTSKPFRVKVNNIEIEAVGTRFSVSASANDNMVTTTLEEGKLKIFNKGETCYLHAGEQALLTNTDPIKVTSNKDTLAKALAWKNDFWFSRDGMENVMKQLEKWYHFTTVYKTSSIPQGEFTAGISKNEPLRGVLNSLEEKFHVRMEIRGNLVFVKPKP